MKSGHCVSSDTFTTKQKPQTAKTLSADTLKLDCSLPKSTKETFLALTIHTSVLNTCYPRRSAQWSLDSKNASEAAEQKTEGKQELVGDLELIMMSGWPSTSRWSSLKSYMFNLVLIIIFLDVQVRNQ